jgi:drug/metabolite transporter (DMT)-like permease
MSEILSKQTQHVPLRVYIVLVCGLLSIFVASILIRMAQNEGVNSILIAASRVFIASLALSPLVITRYWVDIRKLRTKDFGMALLSGAFLSLHFASWVTSLEYTSVLISNVFVTSSPIWVAFMEFFFLRSKLPRLVIIGLIIAVIGGLLIGFAGQFAGQAAISTDPQRELIGGVLSLIGAVTVGAYFVIGRNLQQVQMRGGEMHRLPIIPYIWLVYGSSAIILSIWVVAAGIPITGYSNEAYLIMLATAIFPQLIGHSSLNYAVGYLPATLVSMVTQLEPIGSATLAYYFFQEVPLPLQIVGSITILCGVALANYGQSQLEKQKKVAS